MLVVFFLLPRHDTSVSLKIRTGLWCLFLLCGKKRGVRVEGRQNTHLDIKAFRLLHRSCVTFPHPLELVHVVFCGDNRWNVRG